MDDIKKSKDTPSYLGFCLAFGLLGILAFLIGEEVLAGTAMVVTVVIACTARIERVIPSIASASGAKQETPMTDIAKMAAPLTLRQEPFSQAGWQIWDAHGEKLHASFATRGLLLAALPAVRAHLEGER